MQPGSRPVSEIMQTQVASLSAGDRLDLAEDIMRLGRVRHMPVLEAARLVGVVSARDVLAASLTKALDFEPAHRRSFLRSVEVSEVMSRDVVTVEPDTTLREAAELLLSRKIGCLPVVKPDRTLVGLVTETDLLRAAYLPGTGS
jgi:CBS domain-containing protein